MWQYALDNKLVKYFEGENIWSKNWKPVGETTVADPQHGQYMTVTIYEVGINGSTKQFIATEVINGCWAFFLPVKH